MIGCYFLSRSHLASHPISPHLISHQAHKGIRPSLELDECKIAARKTGRKKENKDSFPAFSPSHSFSHSLQSPSLDLHDPCSLSSLLLMIPYVLPISLYLTLSIHAHPFLPPHLVIIAYRGSIHKRHTHSVRISQPIRRVRINS